MRYLIKMTKIKDLEIGTVFLPAFKNMPAVVCADGMQVNLETGFLSQILDSDEGIALSHKQFEFVDSGQHQLEYGDLFRFRGNVEPFIFGCNGSMSLKTFTSVFVTKDNIASCDVIPLESLFPIVFGGEK